MLEITLDGALCKFLLDTVDYPLCHEVFKSINADESRHLGVDFHVLEMLGHGPFYQSAIKAVGTLASPKLLLGIAAYLPLLNRMRDNIVALGLKEEKLYTALNKYRRVGGTPQGRRNAWFQIIAQQGSWVVNRKDYLYHVPIDALVKLSDYYPRALLKPLPTWFKQLSWRPTA